MKNPVDVHIGQRLRQKRWLSGLTQQALAETVGIRFQQIQKYESGTNRISASRLWQLARTLDVPASYFYEGLGGAALTLDTSDDARIDSKETFELLRAYYDLSEPARRRMLALTQALAGTEEGQQQPLQLGLSANHAR
jgi:transcriptional regulator with XRE-family HTH domain